MWWLILTRWTMTSRSGLTGLSVSFYRLFGPCGWCVGIGWAVGPLRGRCGASQGGCDVMTQGVELSTGFE